MTIDDLGAVLDRVLKATPFRGIDICLVSGTRHRVNHPESLKFFPQTAALVIVDTENHLHIIDSDQIEEVTQLRGRNSGGNSRRKGNASS